MPLRTLLLTAAVVLSSAASLHAGPVWYALAFGAPEVSTESVFGTIDPATGAVTPIGPNAPNLGRDLAVSPTGAVYGIFDTNLYSIDKLTGSAALIGALPAGVHTLAFRSDGVLFGADATNVYTLNPATGAGALLGASGIGFGMDNIRFDPAGNLYVMSAEADSRLFMVDQTTGAASLIGASGVDDISLGGFSGGAFLGTHVAGQPRLVSVDPLTGLATEGAATGGTIYLIALDPASVPEPGTLGLLTAGFGVLIAGARRTSRKAPSAACPDSPASRR